jgi:hypothetical protein
MLASIIQKKPTGKIKILTFGFSTPLHWDYRIKKSLDLLPQAKSTNSQMINP